MLCHFGFVFFNFIPVNQAVIFHMDKQTKLVPVAEPPSYQDYMKESKNKFRIRYMTISSEQNNRFLTA